VAQTTAGSLPGWPRELESLLRCPRCRGTLDCDGELRCAAGHAYPVVRGIPRLLTEAWRPDSAELVAATSEAFGQQWNEFGEAARVGPADLRLHLPTGLTEAVFSGTVLDAGCGMGRYAALAAELGASVIGLDLSLAVEKARQLWSKPRFVQGDLAAPPFAPASFDVVYSFGVIHHLPEPLRGFQTCFELVRSGGLLLVWVYSAHGGLPRRGRVAARRLVARAPWLLRPLSMLAAAGIWAAYVAPRRARGARGGRLGFYADKGFRQLRVDCHDALAAPSEVYLTAADCRAWLRSVQAASAGFERRRDGSGWILWARR